MSHSIISLWSGPRNISTALMYSFAQRDDMVVVDEPLYAHYLQITGFDHPGRMEVLASQPIHGPLVVDQVFRQAPSQKNLFVKNMAKHLTELDRSFLSGLHNIILIRDPKEMLTSFTNQVAQPNLQETALSDQLMIMTELDEQGIPVLVVDAQDILNDPEGSLTELCQFAGLQFQREMLQWKAGPRSEDGIWARYWYHNVHRSTGFGDYRPKNIQIRPELEPLLKECQIYYDQLYHSKFKLTK